MINSLYQIWNIIYMFLYKRLSYISTFSVMKNHQQGSYKPELILNYRPISRLSMDLKVIPRGHKGHIFIICIIDEVTYYLITVTYISMKSKRDRRCVNRAHVITKYWIPDCIIMDWESVFMSSLRNYLFSKLDIKIKMVAPFNHQSLQAEDMDIKSLSTILMKHLTNLGLIWPKYLS